jgi:hypothetical protein
MSTRTFDASVFIGDDDSTYTTTSSDYHSLTIWGDTLQIVKMRTPASSTDTGNAGEICYDSNYVYICISNNNWNRIGLSSF